MNRALVRAGVVPYDQSPVTEQTTQMEAIFDSLHAYGVDEGFIRWELADIPTELDHALIKVLASQCADTFGVSNERYQRLKIGEQEGMNQIYAYNELHYTGDQGSTYF